jgi:polyketide biosynthesis 3-hydroxy-3-methylglutaryl-CoA synthase-like enzyme PksG
MPEYEEMSDLSVQRMAGVQDLKPDLSSFAHIFEAKFEGSGLLVLDGIADFRRRYRWA